MSNNIDKKEPVAICDQSKMNVTKCDMTKEECLKSQIVTLNEKQGQHLKYMPYAFTEQGVAMLSSVLRSKTAIEVNMHRLMLEHSVCHMTASFV